MKARLAGVRWPLLLCVLLAAPVQGALLQDTAGDVGIRHCETATTPSGGFEAMDLLEVRANETPDHIGFTVQAAGLQEEARADAGNYFVYLQRGQQHYTLRMFQANSGTGAVAQLIQTEGISLFGRMVAELPATIDGNAHTIATAVPRALLLDDDGSVPLRGQVITGIMASAEAHATGIYFCSFDGSDGGPAIIQDRAPDDLDPAKAAALSLQYGGGQEEGPIRLGVERPFRASNGEATTYAFDVTVANDGETATAYDVRAEGLPDGWRLVRPDGTLVVGAAEERSFTVYLQVPFQHTHGTTSSFDLAVTAHGGSAHATHQMGVHYLGVPQPAGHHATVHLHSVASLSPVPMLDETFGVGANQMYFNTLEEDGADQQVPVANQLVDGELAWFGCLGPRLALGLSPDRNATGAFEFRFASDVETAGTLHGKLRLVAPEQRRATCHDARGWDEGTVLATLRAEGVSLEGTVSGPLERTFDADIPYTPGTDLLLEIRLTPAEPVAVGGTVDLLGGSLQLPLADHHDPAPDVATDVPAPGFVPEAPPQPKQSPAVWAALGLACALLRRR